MSTRPLLWRAGMDRISHAFRHREARTLCDRLVVLERLAWPAGNVCPVCQERSIAEVATVR